MGAPASQTYAFFVWNLLPPSTFGMGSGAGPLNVSSTLIANHQPTSRTHADEAKFCIAKRRKGEPDIVLHRDIFWLGRQWCVTGFGIQVIDKKMKMRFDVPASRIWEEGLANRLVFEAWFDADDFAQALAAARQRAQDDPKIFAPPLSDER